ncbi:hypothetical protein R0K19_23430, partial [Bacillus sp. SIMBA_161]
MIRILLEAEKVVFLSPSYIPKLLEKVPLNMVEDIMNKVTWIPNGIENHWLDSELNLKNLKEKSLNIIQVGGLNKNKNA